MIELNRVTMENELYNRAMDVLMSYELTQHIGIYLSPHELTFFRSACKHFNKCVTDDYFWKLKIKHDFGIDKKSTKQSWKERYKCALKMGPVIINGLVGTPKLKLQDNPKGDIDININAMKAKVMGGNMFYLTDDLSLYMVNILNMYMIRRDEVAINKYIENNLIFVDKDITEFEPIPFDGICCIKDGNLYIYSVDNKHVIQTKITISNKVTKIKFADTDDGLEILYIDDEQCYEIQIWDPLAYDIGKGWKIKPTGKNCVDVSCSIYTINRCYLTENNVLESLWNEPISNVIKLCGYRGFINETGNYIEQTFDRKFIKPFDNIFGIINVAHNNDTYIGLTKYGELYVGNNSIVKAPYSCKYLWTNAHENIYVMIL